MGTDKALLELDGTPLIARATAAALEVCGGVSLVGDPAKYGGLGFAVVPDEIQNAGPLAGIEAALRVTAVDWNLILACDMPALDPAILETLFAGIWPDGDCALPANRDGKLEPLCAVYHRRCHDQIRAALRAGVRKITEALTGLAIRYVPVARDDAFTNLNTPEDLRRYRNG
jgi:molybdopterin-guanine dinucleotide biosynthesis protein A